MPTDSSDLSSLSSLSPAPSGDELDDVIFEQTAGGKTKSTILKFFPKISSKPTAAKASTPPPPPRKRSPSPPHEYVLADNPDIAFLVMFRSRFNDAFPKSLAHFGPQELERDIVEPIPGDRVEHFLCAVLGLLLNRKQDVKSGHYGRALEDAIITHKLQWPSSWEDKSPLSGGTSFNTLKPSERLRLLRTLVLWAMASSETLKTLINTAYKQNRHEDDINQPRAVQPWGSDGDKRRYFLIEGQDDTAFRVYRESSHQGMNRTWWSVAGTIEELRTLANKLDTKDGGPKAKKLSQKIMQAVPRFEAGEEKRRRRDYRQMRKEQFKRPEPGFSLYEGRTRGKRVKYTFSDDEEVYSDSTGYRRSARNTGASTPAEPTVTASGRTIKAPSRLMATGEDLGEDLPADLQESGPDEMSFDDENDDEASDAGFGDDEQDPDAQIPEESDDDEFDEDEAMVEDDLDIDEPRRLVVKLSLTPKLKSTGPETSSAMDRDGAMDATSPTGSGPSKVDFSAVSNTMADDPVALPRETTPETHQGVLTAELALRASPEKPHAKL